MEARDSHQLHAFFLSGAWTAAKAQLALSARCCLWQRSQPCPGKRHMVAHFYPCYTANAAKGKGMDYMVGGWGGGHTTCPASLQTGRICTVHPGISPLLNTVLCAAHCVRHVQSKAQTFFILIFFNRRYRVFFSICTFYSS